MDGIDVASLKSDGRSRLERGPTGYFPYSKDIRSELASAMADCQRRKVSEIKAHDFEQLSHRLTMLHGEAVGVFLKENDLLAGDIDVIGFHGQTLVHRPEEGFTLQIGSGALLSEVLKTSVVSDFRSADVAAGGEGAPLVPIFHDALISHMQRHKPVALLNLGGVGNLTFIGRNGDLLAFDTGPGGALIDDWVKKHTMQTHDEGGKIAAKGYVDEHHLGALLKHDYFLRKAPKSLDRNDFNSFTLNDLSLEDGAATLAAFTAEAVALAVHQLPEPPNEIIVMGGGRHNNTMMAMIAEKANLPIVNSDDLGLNGDAIEAQAFAYLAIRRLENLPITFPGTTGVHQAMTGGVIHTAS